MGETSKTFTLDYATSDHAVTDRRVLAASLCVAATIALVTPMLALFRSAESLLRGEPLPQFVGGFAYGWFTYASAAALFVSAALALWCALVPARRSVPLISSLLAFVCLAAISWAGFVYDLSTTSSDDVSWSTISWLRRTGWLVDTICELWPYCFLLVGLVLWRAYGGRSQLHRATLIGVLMLVMLNAHQLIGLVENAIDAASETLGISVPVAVWAEFCRSRAPEQVATLSAGFALFLIAWTLVRPNRAVCVAGVALVLICAVARAWWFDSWRMPRGDIESVLNQWNFNLQYVKNSVLILLTVVPMSWFEWRRRGARI